MLGKEIRQVKGYYLYLGTILLFCLSSEAFHFGYILLIERMERVSKGTSMLSMIRFCALFIIGWGSMLFFKGILKEKLRKKLNDVLKRKWMELVFLKEGESLERIGSGSFQFAFWKLDRYTDRFEMISSVCVSTVMLVIMAFYIIVAMGKVFLFLIVGLIFAMFISQILSAPLESKRSQANAVERKSVALMNNMFEGIDIIKNYGMERPIHSMFATNLDEIARRQRDEKKYSLLVFVYNQFIRCLVMAAIPAATALFVGKGMLDSGLIVISTFAFFYFLEHMMSIMENMGKLKEVAGDLQAAEVILDLPERFRSNGESLSLPVRIDGLCAAYGDVNVFKEKTLDIAEKGVIIVKGESGKGKSTFLKCLMGYKRPSDGYLIAGDKKINLAALSMIASYAPQEPVLLAASAYENIKMGIPDATDTDVEMVLDELCPNLAPLLAQCQDALKLSGGQKQIIGLARTVISNAQVIVWDEPTSALNEEMSKQVINYVKNASEKRTFLIASHDCAFLDGSFPVYEI